MLKIHVALDTSAVISRFAEAKEKAARAVVRALNKTATTARAEAAREIRDVGYGLKIAAIKNAISIRRASDTELRAAVRARGRPTPLGKYGARQTKAGVSVAVLNGRKIIKGAFIATMKSGHHGVYVRVDSAAGRKFGGNGRKGFKITRGRTRKHDRHGLPIDELFGPGIPQAFVNDTVQAALTAVIRERFGVVLKQELKFIGLEH